MRRALAAVALAAAACTSSRSSTSPPVPPAAADAVTAWLGHLAAHDDRRAYDDLAPRSREAVGDEAQYERGSARFGATYQRYAGVTPVLLRVSAQVAVATLTKINASAAVSVRRVGPVWKVDPILDAGAYSIDPPDGSTVAPTAAVTVRHDDPQAHARVWFDATESTRELRPVHPLRPGQHVVTVVIQRGDDVVAHALTLVVAG